MENEDPILAPAFTRPRGTRLGRLIDSILGPVPEDLPMLSGDDLVSVERPVPWWMASVLALGLMVIAMVTIRTWPVTGQTPITFVAGLAGLSDRWKVALSTGGAMAFVIFLLLHQTRTKGKAFSEFAVVEESIFRAGCERWTWRQRVVGCLVFGLAHLLNLVVPICVVGYLSVTGAIIMGVYLREYRRTKSSTMATLTAADFHVNYNMSVMAIGAVGMLVLVIVEVLLPLLR